MQIGAEMTDGMRRSVGLTHRPRSFDKAGAEPAEVLRMTWGENRMKWGEHGMMYERLSQDVDNGKEVH